MQAFFGVYMGNRGLIEKSTSYKDVEIEGPYITLRRIGDGTLYDLAVTYDADTHTATLVSQQGLAAGSYEVVVSDGIVDAESGLALDGEMDVGGHLGLLPSGDGVPGGNAVIKLGVGGRHRPGLRLRPTQ